MALFCSPIAYVALAFFALVTSLWFVLWFQVGTVATLRYEFSGILYVLILVAPAISMRMLSEEFQSGTIELLLTSPITDAQIVIGKWLGSLMFFAVLLSPVVVHVLILEWYAEPEWGPIITGFVGLLLAGGLYLAIGAVVSASNRNLVASFFITALLIGIVTYGMYLLAAWEGMPAFLTPLRDAAPYINVTFQYENFAKGLIDIRNLLYFVSAIAMLLYTAVKLLESKRWR